MRHHLLDLEQSFKEALSDLSITKNHALYIDGIDYRPEQINYREYIECIKGLGEAVWQLNTDFFSGIRDSKGRIKICLLVRPDVLNSLNLYNSNSRIQDNSILLDWSTTDDEHKDAKIYELCDKFLSSQQNSKRLTGASWEHYFNTPKEPSKVFKHLIKTTFHKPRDFLTFVKIARDLEINNGKGSNDTFSENIISAPQLSKKFSEYLLGEVRNYAAFYMTQEDFTKYIKFFQFLDGKQRFSAAQFSAAFKAFKEWAGGEDFNAPMYLKDEETLLQLFYDVNVIGYREITELGNNFFHWAYRERTLNNIAPRVKFGAELFLNPGIAKALDVGSQLKAIDQKSDRAPFQGRRKKHRNYHGKGSPQKSK
ncbi:P-loop ATPase, Sll1717 family [Pseudomonas sp. B3G-3]|uniref:P-loop ATPase, Sll1717 family n=1 Tax=Pseudomonas sp. B3G-3 TaxID=3027853 RepID=UPI003FD67835